ncbi:hypothetical protein IJZ97_06440 [bacterium]|nr:hypothetical protein [bacterium]
MSVQRVEENKSSLGHGIKSAAIGGAIGYASKWALPLTSQEMDDDYKQVVRSIKANTARSRREFLKEVNNLPEKSLAQDAFVKSSKEFASNSICTYNKALKKIRPAAPFIIAGAVTGLVGSFVHKVFKTEVH